MSGPPFKVKALFEYASPHEDDLQFSEGQIITVTEEEDEEWYVGEYTNAEGVKQDGLFPKNFVERFEPTAPPRPTRTARPKKETEPVSAPVPVPQEVEQPAAAEPAEPAEPLVREPEVQSPPPVLREHEHKTDEDPQLTQTPFTKPLQSRPMIPASPPQQQATFEPPPKPVQSKPAPPPAPAPAPTPAVSSEQTPEKPVGSFKDRIAAFNKAAAPPVAPFKPSGLSGNNFIKKPFVAPPPSKNAYVPPPRDVPPPRIYKREEDPEIAAKEQENQENAEKAGLAPTQAGDGEEQPKPTSLKERIALLQKQQMEQAARHAEALQKKEKKPRPPPKKRSESQGPPEAPATPAVADEGADLARHDTHETAGRISVDSTREESLPIRAPPRRKSSKGPAAEYAESLGDGNDADMSGAGYTTEEPEESTGRADVDEHHKKPPHEPTEEPVVEEDEEDEQRAETHEQQEEEEEEDEADEEEDDIDPEIRRREELRARMAKMSGGMGMHGMFGPPGGLPMMPPAPAPKKKKASESSKKSLDAGSDDAAAISHAPPVPIMALPGMSRAKSSERSQQVVAEPEAQIEEEEDAEDERDLEPTPIAQPDRFETEIEDAQPVLRRQSTHGSVNPSVPGSRPAPPPVPSESRPPPPPIPSAAPLMSPSAGSESGDELSLRGVALDAETEASQPSTRPPPPRPIVPPVPSRSAEEPTSPLSPKSPTMTNKRNSRLPPPIPGSAPPVPSQSRPPPPPPPGSLSRASTGDGHVQPPPPPIPAREESEEEEITEYEGDYDTDIASAVPHKDALKSHARDSSVDEPSSLKSPTFPPPIPNTAPRAAPPPLPTQPPPSRKSVDMPRAAPPPPPPQRGEYEAEEEDYDEPESIYDASPTRTHSIPTIPSVHQERAPPPPPRDAPSTVPSRSMPPPRKSTDLQRVANQGRRSVDMSRMSMDSGFVANDVDLGSTSKWWTQPNSVPPVFQNRRDILFETEESTSTNGGTQVTITKELYILFHDYSQTIITAQFDPHNPSDVRLEQRHEAPPARLRQDQLEEAHERFGRAIGEAAAGRKDSVVGDGSPYGLVKELLRPFNDALPPVGTRGYGALVYSNLANASTQQNDEIRAGDIISFRNTKFQGKHGAMHAKYTAEVGKPDHVAIVSEWDGTKKKVRAWEQGRENKKVKLESFKLDDLRSGEVKIWRVMPRSWVGWQRN